MNLTVPGGTISVSISTSVSLLSIEFFAILGGEGKAAPAGGRVIKSL